MVAFMSRKSESKTEIAAARVPGQVQRLAVFGPPLLLEGEDAAAYDELLGRICAAVKPVDIIDEMFIADIVALEWEVLRWRRLKRTLIREARPRRLGCQRCQVMPLPSIISLASMIRFLVESYGGVYVQEE